MMCFSNAFIPLLFLNLLNVLSPFPVLTIKRRYGANHKVKT